MPEIQNLSVLAYTFGISFFICGLLVLTKAWHLKINSKRNDDKAVQAAHTTPTPRIGGVGVVVAAVVSFFLVEVTQSGGIAPVFAISVIPVFVAGILEDLGFRVPPRERLVAAAISSAVAIAILQVCVQRSDVPGIDKLFSFAPVAVLFTLFATAGICNAFNLIDGLNGLASATAIIVAGGLAAIAARSGHAQLGVNALLIASTLLGFLVLNFPFGKIFLGDAGAYSVGHILAWVAIVLLARAPDVSPWAVLLIFFWPLADTCFAIYRRKKSGKPTNEPDRLHHHQLVMRGIEILALGSGRRRVANPLATLLMLPMIASPVVVGVILWNRPVSSIIALFLFGAAFLLTYYVGLKFIVTRRRQLSLLLALPKSNSHCLVRSKIAASDVVIDGP